MWFRFIFSLSHPKNRFVCIVFEMRTFEEVKTNCNFSVQNYPIDVSVISCAGHEHDFPASQAVAGQSGTWCFLTQTNSFRDFFLIVDYMEDFKFLILFFVCQVICKLMSNDLLSFRTLFVHRQTAHRG